jgi:hypothetical protein
MTETFTALDEIFRLRPQIPLDEVSALTGFPLGPLLADCRAGRVDHQWRKGKYYMSKAQVEKLLAGATRKARPGARPGSAPGETASAADIQAWRERTRASLRKKVS